jgi:hypothetical protein
LQEAKQYHQSTLFHFVCLPPHPESPTKCSYEVCLILPCGIGVVKFYRFCYLFIVSYLEQIEFQFNTCCWSHLVVYKKLNK